MKLLYFIAFFILAYYLVKSLFKIFMPILVRRFMRKTQERMMDQMGYEQPPKENKRKKEGEVNVDYIPKKKKKANKDDMGDYIDFEDVKEV